MGYRIITTFFTLIFLIIISFSIFNTAIADVCHDCHGTDGGYTFEHITLRSLTARVVNPDRTFEHDVEIHHPGEYKASSIIVKVILDNAPEFTIIGKDSEELSPMDGGTKTVTFKLKAGNPSQSQRIRTTIEYISNYHYDPTVYTETLDISITIDRILLSPSTWSIDMEEGEQTEITIEALENVQNVLIIPSSTLENFIELDYEVTNKLSKGVSFSIQIKAKSTGNGKLNLVYEDEDGGPHKLTLDIVAAQKGSTEDDTWVLIGMITGFLSFFILIFVTLIGVPMLKLKPAFNKVFRNAVVRKEVHCWLCYILVILVLFHAVSVMVNHWNGIMIPNSFIFADLGMNYGLYINLGTISWFSMVLVSVTGIFVKPMAKILKYSKWRLTHNIITLIALIASSVHVAVMLDFRFL